MKRKLFAILTAMLCLVCFAVAGCTDNRPPTIRPSPNLPIIPLYSTVRAALP